MSPSVLRRRIEGLDLPAFAVREVAIEGRRS